MEGARKEEGGVSCVCFVSDTGGNWKNKNKIVRACLHTFSLGNLVAIAGRLNRTPLGVEAIGQVLNNWFNNACAPSRAVAARSSSRFAVLVRSKGFGSSARRRPRSKV